MGRQDLKKYVAGCLKAAGCKRQIISDMAFDAVFHLSHGVARNAAKILGIALRLAHEHDKDIIDDHLIENACKEVLL
jgi:type II secretory pathway predicted ATPase ExeA